MMARAMHRPLFLPPGEIGGVLLQELLRRGEAHRLECFRDSLPILTTASDPMNRERVPHGLLDGHRRVERRMRVLKDDLHAAPNRAEVALRHVGDLLALEGDAPLGRRHESQQGSPERRLPTP